MIINDDDHNDDGDKDDDYDNDDDDNDDDDVQARTSEGCTWRARVGTTSRAVWSDPSLKS